MCTVCGCGQGSLATPDGGTGHHHPHSHPHSHPHPDHQHHHHDHGRSPADAEKYPAAAAEFAGGIGAVHAPGVSQSRIVQIEQDILGENDRFAAANRERLAARGVLALNLVSSPGSGKTTLLVRTIEDLHPRVPIAVIEGDQQTAFDAERIAATGAPGIQINTGKGCHLDAHMVGHALGRLQPEAASVVFIENVGNLVCPAAFDLGEAAKVVILSVTEGEDKPLKYPDMFAAARLMLVSKVDLLPYLSFDVEQCLALARRVNPRIEALTVSAVSGHGMDAWYGWIEQRRVEATVSVAAAAAASG